MIITAYAIFILFILLLIMNITIVILQIKKKETHDKVTNSILRCCLWFLLSSLPASYIWG